MAAYLVGHITVKNELFWQKYVEGVAESLINFEAKVIFRGKLEAVLAGEHTHDLAVVIEFPEMDTLNSWYHSEKYQSIIPVRNQAADVTITSYES